MTTEKDELFNVAAFSVTLLLQSGRLNEMGHLDVLLLQDTGVDIHFICAILLAVQVTPTE